MFVLRLINDLWRIWPQVDCPRNLAKSVTVEWTVPSIAMTTQTRQTHSKWRRGSVCTQKSKRRQRRPVVVSLPSLLFSSFTQLSFICVFRIVTKVVSHRLFCRWRRDLGWQQNVTTLKTCCWLTFLAVSVFSAMTSRVVWVFLAASHLKCLLICP